MNGPIAQITALTCYVNAYLKNSVVAPFFSDNSTCQFCDKITFAVLMEKPSGEIAKKEIAGSPHDWCEYLKGKKTKSLRLFHFPRNDPKNPDRRSVGFVGGGGIWAIEILLPNDICEYWMARWDVGNQNAENRRIWQVTYIRVPMKTPDYKVVPLEASLTALENSLQEIQTFSEKHNCGFTEFFAKALATIRTGNKCGYHQDLVPDNLLSKEAELILDACQSAWVFGGMGTWNDMSFDGAEQVEYDRVSDQLFNTMNSAIVSAVNSA